MTPAPSAPIGECLKDCTPPERHDIGERQPPYDGVRTWGDLETVRARLDRAPRARGDADHT